MKSDESITSGHIAADNERGPRVLLIGSKFSGGGAEARLRYLAQHLFGGAAETALFLKEDKAEVDSLRLPVHDLDWQGRASYPGAVRRLRRIVAQGRYDAALALGLHQNAVLWTATRFMTERPALIMTETTRPITNELHAGRPLISKLRGAVSSAMFKNADLVAANSLDGVAEIVANYGVEPDRIVRLPNMVDRARIMRLIDGPAEALAPGIKSICMVSRLDYMKRVDTLIDAVCAIDPALSWCVEIIGDGPHRGELEAQARQRGVLDRIHFRGWQRNPYPYMARAAATVLCSIYEGFSNTVLESMAIGTPVITSYCSSDARQMVAVGAALGFDVGDSAALSAHLSRLLTDDAKRGEIASHAEAYIAPHRLENAVDAYEAVVRKAIELKGSGGGRVRARSARQSDEVSSL